MKIDKKSMEKAILHPWVNRKLELLKINYGYENDMDEKLSNSLAQASKSGKSNTGTPDHNIKGLKNNKAIIYNNRR